MNYGGNVFLPNVQVERFYLTNILTHLYVHTQNFMSRYYESNYQYQDYVLASS